MGNLPSVVIAGLVPAIHVFFTKGQKVVDARAKHGHDGSEVWRVIGRYPVLTHTAVSSLPGRLG